MLAAALVMSLSIRIGDEVTEFDQFGAFGWRDVRLFILRNTGGTFRSCANWEMVSEPRSVQSKDRLTRLDTICQTFNESGRNDVSCIGSNLIES